MTKPAWFETLWVLLSIVAAANAVRALKLTKRLLRQERLLARLRAHHQEHHEAEGT